MKKVLVISTSMRVGHNSDHFAQVFCDGAISAGHEVEYISLKGRKISFCIGCSACHTSRRCVLQDDAAEIIEKMKQADVLVFATPIYFFEMSGQMKTLLDRTNPLFMEEYAFRDVYLLTAAHDGRAAAVDRCIAGLEGWLECFERAKLAGVVRGNGLSERGDAQSAPELLAQVYRMAANI